jgi:hypothetical protein
MVVFKFKFNSQKRRLKIHSKELSFALLLTRIAEDIAQPSNLIIVKYKDDDGDWVTMSCEEDLLDAMEFAGKKHVKLDVSLAMAGEEIERRLSRVESPVIVFEESAGEEDEEGDFYPVIEEVKTVEASPEVVVQQPKVDLLEVLRKALEQDEDSVKRIAAELGYVVEKPVACVSEPVVSPVVKVEEEKKEEPVIHDFVVCDGCGASPITGIRYKCTICSNFDLCSNCEAAGVHPNGHPLLKVKVPKNCGMEGSWRRRGCDMERHSRRHGSPMRCPRSRSDRLYAKFIEDVTIPDRSYLAPGSSHNKTWVLQNTGSTAWPAGNKLHFVSGDRDTIDPASFDMTLPEVAAGDRVEVSVGLRAPMKAGRYIVYFRLEMPNGSKFGPRFWVDFFVPEAAAPEVPVPNKDFAKLIEKHRDAIDELRAMGMGDDLSLNVYLLERFEGNVGRVVNWYLDSRM